MEKTVSKSGAFVFMVISLLFLFHPVTASAVYECAGQTDDCQCNASNPFPCDLGNCTWWAWHKICCTWGEEAARDIVYNWETPRDAHTWNDKAESSSVFTVSDTPAPGTVAVREAYSDNSYLGHVAWVESVSGSQITVTEMMWGVSFSGGYRTKTYNASHFDGGFISLNSGGMPPPNLSSPSDGAIGQLETLRLDWNDVSGATVYRVFISDSYECLNSLTNKDKTCYCCVENELSYSSFYDVPSGILDECTTYYWMVRAGNATDGSDNSAIWEFTTKDSSLATPSLSSPADGAIGQSETLRLDWGDVSGAEKYRVFVSESESCLTNLSNKDKTCDCCVINKEVFSSYYDVGSGDLDECTTYYWMVRAGNSCAGSHNSSVREFTTKGSALATPSLTYPLDEAAGQSVTPRLNWDSVTGSDKYRVFVSESESCLTNLSNKDKTCYCCDVNKEISLISEYTVESGYLDECTTYYWMVRAGSSCAGSNNSSVREFATRGSSLDTPALLSPSDGAADQSRTLRLDWRDVNGAESYRVFVSTSYSTLSNLSDTATGCSACVDNYVTFYSHRDVPTGRLSYDTTYYWMVRAGKSCAGSHNSSVRSFKTVPKPISTGSLKVTITPQEAITEGAQWRADGSTWRNSGYTESDLSVETHTVEFKTISGWKKPDNKAVVINEGQTTQVTGEYVPAPPCTKGDVNGDGRITPGDAVAAYELSKKFSLTDEERCVADYNEDDYVTPGDAVEIYEKSKEF
ncbi:CHAP domain-containing protein [Desulfonema magnum]|uniref:CHAP domain-containing protein n=1 Tax=Desulfonema magnum TaxID=45655 RepID=A0A975BM77_9BACT|nr:CHAP domain-containing protein [Desulfonema magnum]QTA88264.1 CHAP domain-containing protein [Desulfonema magnum]